MENTLNEIIKNAEVAKDESELAKAAFKQFFELAKQTLKKKGMFNVAISGGRSPISFYNYLATYPIPKEIDWQKIHLFWVDERCVSPESCDSNYKLAVDTFLSKIPIPETNIHRVMGEAENYTIAVQEYEQVIRDHFHIKVGEFPKFDLITLGVGADGHIASLLPNSCALCDTEDIVATVYQMGDAAFNRITLTIPVLQAASHLLVLITGANKAKIVREIFENEPDEIRYPVHSLWPVLNKVHWILDEEAAKCLHIALHHV